LIVVTRSNNNKFLGSTFSCEDLSPSGFSAIGHHFVDR